MSDPAVSISTAAGISVYSCLVMIGFNEGFGQAVESLAPLRPSGSRDIRRTQDIQILCAATGSDSSLSPVIKVKSTRGQEEYGS